MSYNDQNEAYHPAKYLHVAMDMPTWVLRARVYTAPESIDSIVASSSLSLRRVRVINLSLFIKDSSQMLQQNLSMRSASFIIMAPRSRAFIFPHSPGLFSLAGTRNMDLVKEKSLGGTWTWSKKNEVKGKIRRNMDLVTRAHNLCHDNRQLIVIAINRNHSASKINCN